MIVKAKSSVDYITLYNIYNVDSVELSILLLFFPLKCLLDNHIFISSIEYNFFFFVINAQIVQINIMIYFLYIFFFTLIVSIYHYYIYKYHISNAYSFKYALVTFIITFIMFMKYMVS